MPNTVTQATLDQQLNTCISNSQSRLEFWENFVHKFQIKRMAEIGVYRGDLAAFLLQKCPDLTRYYMVDPWRHLDDWNKPANHADSVLNEFFVETMSKTEFAANKRAVLRGKTTEVIDEIPDFELDFVYIDGDHTLKGIAIDLIRVFSKVRVGGFIGGDDFTRSIWEHNTKFEPTLVFPFAVYFAEAVGAPIYALPHSQFVIQKTSRPQFSLIDLAGGYEESTLRSQFAPERVMKLFAAERFPRLKRAAGKAKRLLSK